MFNENQFIPDFKSGQTFGVCTPEGVMTDIYDASVGTLRGNKRNVKAIICDGTDPSESWVFFNVLDSNNTLHDQVAIFGAAHADQAERLARKHFAYDSAFTFKSPLEVSSNALKIYLDADQTPSGTRYLLPADVQVFDSMASRELPAWDDDNNLTSHGGHLANLILDMAKCDVYGELLEKVTPADVLASLLDDNSEVLIADAMVLKYRQFDATIQKLAQALRDAGNDEFFVKNVTQIEPFKRFGVVNVGAIFEMSDSQQVTVLFNNPDSTPGKLSSNDVLTSWKWILNKRDVTAILQPRAVEAKRYPLIASRMFKLLEKNHARFLRTQSQKNRDELLLAELMNQLDAAQNEVKSLEQQLKELNDQIDSFAAKKQEQLEETLQTEQKDAVDPAEPAAELSTAADPAGESDNQPADDPGADPEPEAASGDDAENNPEPSADEVKREQYMQCLDLLKSYTSPEQYAVLESYIASGEIDGHLEQLSAVCEDIRSIPAVGATDGQGRKAMAYLHYFIGGSDWYVTEKDGPHDAFGYAAHAGFDFEAGYLSISEIVATGAELDLYFNKASIEDLITPKAPATQKPADDTPELNGDEFGDFELPEQLGDLRKVVKEKMLEMVGKAFPCPALSADVQVRKSGVKKVISFSSDVRKLQAIAALKDLLQAAILDESLPSYAPEKEQNIKAYHILKAPLVLEENPITVRFVVREDNQGHYHYDHTIEESALKNAKSPLLDGLSAATLLMPGVWQENLVKPARNAGCQLDNSIENSQSEVKLVTDSAVGGEKEVLNMFIDDEVEQGAADPADNPDVQFLKDVIAGNVDLAADATGERLEQIGQDLDQSIEETFNQAVDAYVQFALKNADSLNTNTAA